MESSNNIYNHIFSDLSYILFSGYSLRSFSQNSVCQECIFRIAGVLWLVWVVDQFSIQFLKPSYSKSGAEDFDECVRKVINLVSRLMTCGVNILNRQGEQTRRKARSRKELLRAADWQEGALWKEREVTHLKLMQLATTVGNWLKEGELT